MRRLDSASVRIAPRAPRDAAQLIGSSAVSSDVAGEPFDERMRAREVRRRRRRPGARSARAASFVADARAASRSARGVSARSIVDRIAAADDVAPSAPEGVARRSGATSSLGADRRARRLELARDLVDIDRLLREDRARALLALGGAAPTRREARRASDVELRLVEAARAARRVPRSTRPSRIASSTAFESDGHRNRDAERVADRLVLAQQDVEHDAVDPVVARRSR